MKQNLKDNLGISIAIGILASSWIFFTDKVGLLSWPGFMGWAMFFFAGANLEAIKKTIPAIILGPILAYITIYVQSLAGNSNLSVIIIGFALGFTLSIAQSFSIFQVAPAIFISCNIYFVTGSMLNSIGVTIFGLILGLLSLLLGEKIDQLLFN